MPGLKDIRRRISSVKNTRQITRAMKLVSAAKLRRAQEAALGSRAFSEKLRGAIGPVLANVPKGFTHPLLTKPAEGAPRRLLVIAGERGLCGGFNTNLLKAVQNNEFAYGKPGRETTEVVSVGRKAAGHARRTGWKMINSFEGLPEDASIWPIEDIAASLIDDFTTGRVGEVVLCYTKFISAMRQEIVAEVLLPFRIEQLVGTDDPHVLHQLSSVKFDTALETIFEQLIPLYLRAKIREAGAESKASEHAARMTAMDSATKNAGDLIDTLQLFYNRARQSAITRELIDIVGGAEAVK